ncbi:hypothetical protein BJAS_P2060 [Bathymodiolus japonicus methanotrophic gill symbiont]|nr:hypothetical protein BJAS_P2060 [Bathymodiolus japonicus methanotrophic gill symbiont]
MHIGSFGAIMSAKFDGWNIISELTLNIMGTPGDITGIRGIPQPYTGTGHGGSAGDAAGLADTFFTTYAENLGESLFLRKLVLGIPAQASSKNLTRPLMPPAAPIRPRHLVPTQQGVGT